MGSLVKPSVSRLPWRTEKVDRNVYETLTQSTSAKCKRDCSRETNLVAFGKLSYRFDWLARGYCPIKQCPDLGLLPAILNYRVMVGSSGCAFRNLRGKFNAHRLLAELFGRLSSRALYLFAKRSVTVFSGLLLF